MPNSPQLSVQRHPNWLTGERAADSFQSKWGEIPAFREIAINKAALLKHPGSFPAAIESRRIDVFIQGTLADFAAALSSAGIPVLLDTGDELASRKVILGRYRGTLGPLLRAVAKRVGLSVSYDGDAENGIVVFAKDGEYLISLVQDEDFLKQVTAGLESLGCGNVMASSATGLVRCRASADHHEAVMRYLRHAIENAATVNLQVAVVTVSLNDSETTGLDWGSLDIRYRDGVSTNGFNAPMPLPPSGSQGNPGDSGDGAGDQVKNLVRDGFKAALTGTTFGIAYQAADFSLKAFLNSLAKYGTSKTEQNLILKTLTGSEVKIRSGSTIPYVSGVSLSSTNVNNNTAGTTLAGVQTATVNTGITVTIKPFFDALSSTVTMNVKIDMKNLLGFVELSAGNQIGSVSQPNTQDQAFNDVARVAAGETVVIGGIVFESVNDNQSNLALLRKLPVASSNQSKKREAMFIVIRPTVTLYRFKNLDQSDGKKTG